MICQEIVALEVLELEVKAIDTFQTLRILFRFFKKTPPQYTKMRSSPWTLESLVVNALE